MSAKDSVLLREGKALCVVEPRGMHGFEGFVAGNTYRFERREFTLESAYGRRYGATTEYCRVWPNHPEQPMTYTTCGLSSFHRYFEEE